MASDKQAPAGDYKQKDIAKAAVLLLAPKDYSAAPANGSSAMDEDDISELGDEGKWTILLDVVPLQTIN
jgi:hypothetical protein